MDADGDSDTESTMATIAGAGMNDRVLYRVLYVIGTEDKDHVQIRAVRDDHDDAFLDHDRPILLITMHRSA